ncbi:MAG: MarR family winged helix-turn-helix transcriptional regulator [Ornithinibacter sp.]
MSDRGARIYSLLSLTRPIVLGSARVVEARTRALGWTVGSRAVMEVLATQAPLTVPQVASRLSLARQNVQRHVDELVRLGDLRATANPAHRRSVLIEVTPSGRRRFGALHANELAELADVAPSCSPQDLETATRVLGALSEDIRRRASLPDDREGGR